MKRGVIFCHGYGHEELYTQKRDLPEDTMWILVDIDPKNRPDLVGSFKSPETFSLLGYDKYDYVYEIGCPLHHDTEIIIKFLNETYKILKEGGYVNIRGLLPDLIRRFNPILYSKGYYHYIEEIMDEFFQGGQSLYVTVLDNILQATNYKSYEVDDSPYLRERGSVIFIK